MESLQDYIPDFKLMIVKWVGPWDLNDYITCIEGFSKKILSLDVQNVIQDITDIAHKVSDDDIKALMIIRQMKITQHFNVVYITDKPNQVVFSELYLNALPDKRTHQYCTTTKKALELLSIKMTEKELNDRFHSLVKGFK
ncbi:MAG: hypothetical protein K9H49_10185 [Bacteroidales bacterium]|nr:hypothetical protein [Bacteroidales bacterium]MCF8389739.1 hypothetical protein [Bacteroidales bacterium]